MGLRYRITNEGYSSTKSISIADNLSQKSVSTFSEKNDLFGGIDKKKKKKMVVPGDKLKLEVKIIKRKGPIGIGEAIATVEDKIVAKGELTFAVV